MQQRDQAQQAGVHRDHDSHAAYSLYDANVHTGRASESSESSAPDTTDDEAFRAGRAALLDTLADLLLRELDAPLAERLAADPFLARALDPPTTAHGLRQLRADYARLFLIEAPPYAALYRDAAAVIGGESARQWSDFLHTHQGRLQVAPEHERLASPDHLGLYLRALAQAERLGAVSLVMREVLSWAPLYLTALEREDPRGFYGRLAGLVAATLQASARLAPSDGAELAGDGGGTVGAADASANMQDVVEAQPDDDLRLITRMLCIPATSGWFLSKREMRRQAQALGANVGLVTRAQMLEQVFALSGLDGRTGDLLVGLRALAEEWQAACQEWIEAVGSWQDVLAPWRRHLYATQAILNRLHEQTRTETFGTSSALE